MPRTSSPVTMPGSPGLVGIGTRASPPSARASSSPPPATRRWRRGIWRFRTVSAWTIPRATIASARLESLSELAKRPVDELHAHRALADRRGHALDAARACVADGEDARPARLQQVGLAGERPAGLLELGRLEVGAGLHEVLLVERHAALQPAGVGIGAGHQEEMTDRARLGLPGVEPAPADPLQAVPSLERVDLRPHA